MEPSLFLKQQPLPSRFTRTWQDWRFNHRCMRCRWFRTFNRRPGDQTRGVTVARVICSGRFPGRINSCWELENVTPDISGKMKRKGILRNSMEYINMAKQFYWGQIFFDHQNSKWHTLQRFSQPKGAVLRYQGYHLGNSHDSRTSWSRVAGVYMTWTRGWGISREMCNFCCRYHRTYFCFFNHFSYPWSLEALKQFLLCVFFSFGTWRGTMYGISYNLYTIRLKENRLIKPDFWVLFKIKFHLKTIRWFLYSTLSRKSLIVRESSASFRWVSFHWGKSLMSWCKPETGRTLGWLCVSKFANSAANLLDLNRINISNTQICVYVYLYIYIYVYIYIWDLQMQSHMHR